jgi:hypothetical protein
MSKSVLSLALAGMIVLSLAGCGGEPQQEQKAAATPAPEVKKEEPPPPLYDITKESLTSHPDWTSRNVQVLGTKIGDKTTTVQNNFGKLENTRTLPQRGPEPAEYLTIYQGNGLFVYTQQLTGKLIKFEIYDTFSKQLADDKLKKLLSGGDLKYMREILGPEEKTEENADDQSTEYVYDNKGFRFVKFKVNGKTLNCLRFSEVKKTVS